MEVPMRRLLAPLAVALFAAPVFADDGAAPSVPHNARRTPIVEAVERAAPAVVSVGTTRIVKVRYFDWDFLPQEQHGLGSGVIVHPSGYVVTNAHVINQADQILVKLTGARENEPEIQATLIAADLEHDLALLRLEKPGPYPFVEFARSDDLMVGETVIAIGNPFGLGRTVTSGIVSALDRTLDIRSAKFKGLIQTDAAVNRGNSGGPLLNINGEWIGVNSAIYSLSGGADGISFAIPVDVVRKFVVDSLRVARFAGGWLGLEFGVGADGRMVVERVHPLGPAAKAGVESGARIAGDADPLKFCFGLLEAGKRGAFTFSVAGRDRPFTVSFEKPPTDEIAWRRLGVRFGAVDDAMSERTGYAPGSGLVVLEVKDAGPAQRIGLERGDLVTSLGEARIAAADDLLGVLLEADKGSTRDVLLVRRSRSAFGIVDESLRARIVFE
jgi:serine protease Do